MYNACPEEVIICQMKMGKVDLMQNIDWDNLKIEVRQSVIYDMVKYTR